MKSFLKNRSVSKVSEKFRKGLDRKPKRPDDLFPEGEKVTCLTIQDGVCVVSLKYTQWDERQGRLGNCKFLRREVLNRTLGTSVIEEYRKSC